MPFKKNTDDLPGTVGALNKGPLQGVIFGVDLDGVCADFYGKMREIAAEWFERRIEDLTKNVSYGLPEWGVKSEDEYQSSIDSQ